MLNATFQSHPIKMGCCNTNKNSLIVTTINPIWCSHAVHPGTKNLQFVALKVTEICPSQRGEHFKAPCSGSGWMKT